MSFGRICGDKYGKKLMNTATKTGIDAEKTASNRVIRKTAEATLDLIGNKIAGAINTASKSTNKEKDETMKHKKFTYHQIKFNKLLML